MPIIWDDGGAPELTLRQKIIGTLNRVAMAIVNGISTPIRDGARGIWTWINDTAEDAFVDVCGSWLRWYVDQDWVPEPFREPVRIILSRHHPAFLAVLVPILIGIGTAAMMNMSVGGFRLLSMRVMRWLRPARPSYRDAIMAWVSGRANWDTVYSNLADMGFPDDIISYLSGSLQQSPPYTIVADMLYRGFINELDATAILRLQGWPPELIPKVIQTLPNLPSVADLITMLAREAFEPDMIEHYGLGDEYPELFTEAMAKLGYAKEWSLRHWYKHWDVPSLTQVYDMLHRGVLEQKDVWDFFRLVEISPFWRDKLIQIQYRLPTRVDVRRMYRDGHLTRDEVYELYKKLGYDPENAELLTDLAVSFYKSADKNLTRSDIQTAYKTLGWSRDEALEMLVELGYSGDEASYYLDYADYQRAKEYTDTAEKLIKTQYVRGIIDQATANARLGELGESIAQIATLVSLWTLEKDAQTEHPTVSQLGDFYERRIITGPQYEAELSHLNYTPEYIGWIHAAIDSRIAEENARKSAAELRAEMARHRYPALADLNAWLQAALIDEATYRERILGLGYSLQDADRYTEAQRQRIAGRPAYPSRADLGRWLQSGLIDEAAYRERMAGLRYGPEDIARYLAELRAAQAEV